MDLNTISGLGDGIFVPSDSGNSGISPEKNLEGENETHKGDLYIASTDRNYVLDKTVDGNAFIVGTNVKITGKVNGSLFVCASRKG